MSKRHIPSPPADSPVNNPLEAGSNFILIPGEYPPDKIPSGTVNRIPIRLSRGKAFGSGLHETTISCIEAIERLSLAENSTVLDVGTGTGILSLAALLLGAKSAVAFDIDEDAVTTCRRNANINGLNPRLKVFQGTLGALNPSVVFDLVLANIYGDIVLKKAENLAAHTREGGHLILSGLDYTDSSPVKVSMCKLGMVEVSVRFLEEYVTQVWHRPPGRD